MKRNLLALLLMFMMILVGCSSEEQTTFSSEIAELSSEAESVSSEEPSSEPESSEESGESAESSEQPESSEESQEEIILPDHNLNPLSGLYDLKDAAVNKRPVAVMVNNVRVAMPQYGIEKADVIFEIGVEGLQTRFMCLFADYTSIPRVCSVRSCRKYFPAMSEGFDAIYINCGQNKVINSYVKSLGLTQYDGAKDGRLFARDQDRLQTMAVEHTLYLDGPRLPEILEADGARTDIEEDKIGPAFNFSKETVIPSGDDCTYVAVDFGTNKSAFSYDEATKTYKKTYWDSKEDVYKTQIDGKTENQLSFTNVFVLETLVGYDKTAVYNNKGDMHRLVEWKGGDDSIGYYISNGKIQKIHWKKENEQSRLKFYDESGNELAINCGKTYICFNNVGEADFE